MGKHGREPSTFMVVQQVKNAMEMINAIVHQGPILPANEEDIHIEEIGYNEEGEKQDFAAWEDEMEAYYEKHGWENIREMDFEKGGSSEETAHKKSVKECEQKECSASGSGTQKNDEESEDKKSVNEEEQKECVESTQKNVEGSEDKKSVKEDEQKECVDTGSGAQEC